MLSQRELGHRQKRTGKTGATTGLAGERDLLAILGRVCPCKLFTSLLQLSVLELLISATSAI